MKNPLKLENIFLSKKNFPLLLTGLLTLFLLFLFGSEQFNEDGSSNPDFANELYSATLKPLFSSSSIDKKDMLTFAVKGDLPLNKKNRVLQVGVNSDGKETLELVSNRKIVANNDYSRVVKKLKLTEMRRVEFDSILNSYQHELANLIYLADDSLVAVNPKIGLLRNSINYDLSTFIREIKYNLPDDSYVGESRDKRLYDVHSNQSDGEANNYIIFTPDSVLRREYSFVEPNGKRLELEPKVLAIKTLEKVEPFENDGFSFEFDSNFVKVILDKNYGGDINLHEVNLFKMVIDSSQNDSKLSFEIREDSLENVTLKFSYVDSLNNKIRYEINSDDIGTAITNSIKTFSGKDIDEWIEYGIQMDSISRALNSAANNKNKKLD